MNVENTSTEGVIDINVEVKVEEVSENYVESDLDLYADHEIKEEMVIGPVVLQPVVYTSYRPEDVPVPKKLKLETADEETDQVKPQKGMKEDRTEGIISKNSSKNIETKTTLRNTIQANQICNQTPGLSEIFICNECGIKFRKKYKLVQHVKCHQEKLALYKCKDSSSNVSRRLLAHTGDKSYSCAHCDYKCKQSSHLSRHLCNHTREKHTGGKPYSCSHCDYKSKQKGHLSRHLRIHTGENLHACSYCDHKFNQKGDLLSHLRIHTGEKPYSCSHCDYKCKQSSHLSRHLRIHTGEKSNSCSHCDLKFNRKSDLLIHLRIHTGEKPYSCPHCDHKFNRKGSLTRHLRIHTGEKPYSCSHCDYKCARKSSLTNHLLRFHADEISK